MWFKRMPLEEWFDKYQYETRYDIGESSVQCLSFDEVGIELGQLPLKYGFHRGYPELRELIATQYDGVSLDQVLVTNGAAEALFDLAAALLKPGDHVIVEHPNYASNYEVPRSLGCKVDLLKLRFEGRFKPDLQELKELLTPQTKLVSLTHPNNPTGAMVSRETLERIIEFVELHNAYLLFDETYRELTFNGKLPAAASLSPKAISISSMSKAYGLPGIRIGWMATKDKSIIESALAVREQISICNSIISEVMTLSILRRKEEFSEAVRRHVEKNLQLVSDWMEGREELEWIKPEAGVVCFPRFKPSVLPDPEKLYRLLAEKYKTFVVPGRCFEMDNQYFRLGYGGASEHLVRGLTNIENAIQGLRYG